MTWTACSFFVFACFCVTITVVSSVSLRRPLPALIIPIFVFGMLSTEFAWFFLALQFLITVVFVALGALSETLGVVALGLMVISGAGLWRMHRQAHAADEILRGALQQGLGKEFRNKIPAERQPVLRDHIVAISQPWRHCRLMIPRTNRASNRPIQVSMQSYHCTVCMTSLTMTARISIERCASSWVTR